MLQAGITAGALLRRTAPYPRRCCTPQVLRAPPWHIQQFNTRCCCANLLAVPRQRSAMTANTSPATSAWLPPGPPLQRCAASSSALRLQRKSAVVLEAAGRPLPEQTCAAAEGRGFHAVAEAPHKVEWQLHRRHRPQPACLLSLAKEPDSAGLHSHQEVWGINTESSGTLINRLPALMLSVALTPLPAPAV